MNLQPIGLSRIEQDAKQGKNFIEAIAWCFTDCGTKVFTSTGFADLDGPPFKAYYCPACATKLGAA